MPSGLRPLHPIHTPTAASARHRAPPTLCALCTYGARRALRTSAAPPPRWQRHRRLGRGHLRRAVLRRAVGGSRGPERGSTSHTDAALEATVAAWPMRQLTGGPPACTGLLCLRGGRCPSRGPRGENPCRVAAQEKKRALWRGALWWLPDDARSIFGPPGAGKCMVVVVNGLLSNGRLPHAYYYKRPALSRGRTIRAGVRARGSPTCSRPLSRLHA